MAFCWFTSFIGYPDFFAASGNPAELAKAFKTLARASLDGVSYKDSKKAFHQDPHQVETKKAAFQEFGLLYVRPRSDTITLTPAGRQVLRLSRNKKTLDANRRLLLLTLCYSLSRYQFDNPFPVGGAGARARSAASDVLPYLATYFLLHRLSGVITAQELRGAVFGLQHMRDLASLEKRISAQRQMGVPFKDVPAIPSKSGTANNLRIYFVAHLSLANSIIKTTEQAGLYGGKDQAFELTELGHEITSTVLDSEWPGWRRYRRPIPVARRFANIQQYFSDGVGAACPATVIEADVDRSQEENKAAVEVGIDVETAEAIKDLPHKEYQDGKAKLVQHARIERVRNPALVRDAKENYRKTYGRLFCEVCAFDFEKKYGSRGKDYIEAHHRTPISTLKKQGAITLKISDLAMVCANCHRMLHRMPWITVEDLKHALGSAGP